MMRRLASLMDSGPPRDVEDSLPGPGCVAPALSDPGLQSRQMRLPPQLAQRIVTRMEEEAPSACTRAQGSTQG